jgi:hypothetical protein
VGIYSVNGCSISYRSCCECESRCIILGPMIDCLTSLLVAIAVVVIVSCNGRLVYCCGPVGIIVLIAAQSRTDHAVDLCVLFWRKLLLYHRRTSQWLICHRTKHKCLCTRHKENLVLICHRRYVNGRMSPFSCQLLSKFQVYPWFMEEKKEKKKMKNKTHMVGRTDPTRPETLHARTRPEVWTLSASSRT